MLMLMLMVIVFLFVTAGNDDDGPDPRWCLAGPLVGHMAHHGGRTAPLARTHRPRAHIMSVSLPLTAPLAPLRPATEVTLTAPRPDTERTANEYVETPFRIGPAGTATALVSLPGNGPAPINQVLLLPRPADKSASGRRSRPPAPAEPPVVVTRSLSSPSAVTTITKQPVAFTKEQPAGLQSQGAAAAAAECASGNIICQQCGRCRCESCKQPRTLPQRWVCDNACLCSADAIIDYLSCLCCVKGLYYHCSESDAGTTCADDPCSCGPSRWLARWGCMSALAAVLPCLLCYWPLRGCQRAVEAAYARHSRAGCRCPPRQHCPANPEKRLLDSPSPDF